MMIGAAGVLAFVRALGAWLRAISGAPSRAPVRRGKGSPYRAAGRTTEPASQVEAQAHPSPWPDPWPTDAAIRSIRELRELGANLAADHIERELARQVRAKKGSA